MTVPDEAVEAAALALAGVEDWPESWTDGFKDQYRHISKRSLAAAAPFIAAQALNDAAEELKDKRLLNKPFHEYYPEWLNKKADTYRSGT